MRILVSAYACEPGRGSEPGVGWNWALQVGRFHDAWVITRPCYREAIENASPQLALESIHWVYFDVPRWVRWWNKNDRGIRLHYYVWQICIYFLARKLHRKANFHLVHHVTMAGYWMPSFLALLGIPLIWGPVGGGEAMPRGFWRCLSLHGKVYEAARYLRQALGRLDPFVRITARRAEVGLATTAETANRLRALRCRNTVVCPTIGLPERDRAQLSRIPVRREGPFRTVSIGNLLHLKGFELGIRAFAKIHRQFPCSEYWIVGDGPERNRLQSQARRLGLAGKVKFWGKIPRAQALEKLAECDVLVHPSLHDSGGWVCLEAMAAGRPVICLDLGGPALQVTEATGIKVAALSPSQAVEDLASAMRLLASEPDLRVRMGRAARQRVEEQYNWDKKGESLARLYESVVNVVGEECTIAC